MGKTLVVLRSGSLGWSQQGKLEMGSQSTEPRWKYPTSSPGRDQNNFHKCRHVNKINFNFERKNSEKFINVKNKKCFFALRTLRKMSLRLLVLRNSLPLSEFPL